MSQSISFVQYVNATHTKTSVYCLGLSSLARPIMINGRDQISTH